MEKLKEAYLVRQPAAVIEIQQSDSTTGIMSAKNGICDIGMASRELKADERDSGLDASIIARDGIAIIVNNGNPLGNISKDTLGKIFTGDITAWESVLE